MQSIQSQPLDPQRPVPLKQRGAAPFPSFLSESGVREAGK